jgi:hypothetical protein
MTAGRASAVALAGIAAVFAAQYAWVASTNFSGYDEWLYVSLSSQGIVSYPYENRPLVYLWRLPPALVWPHSLAAYWVNHGLYLVATGWLTYAIVRRLAPADGALSFVAGALAAFWAPTDHARLNTLGLTAYSGLTAGTMAAVALFVEAFARGRAALLGAAIVLGFVCARGTESAVPVLAGAPLLLAFMRGAARGRRSWIVAWEAAWIVAGALALWPVLDPPPGGSRQNALGLDLRPGGVLGRLADQFAFHVLPLFTSPPGELAHVGVALAATLAWLCFRLVAASAPPIGGEERRRELLRLAALGFVFAALGYAAFSMTASLALPVRTQFFAAPGVGVLIAAGAFLALGVLPVRWRAAAGAAFFAWAAAVSTGRTLAMQRDWEAWSTYPVQRAVLAQLVERVPDVPPNTLIVLFDETGAFKATFTFRHAVSYLYQSRAVGFVWGASDFLYPCRFAADGVECRPWPVIAGPWRTPPTFHRYDEVVGVHFGADGELSVLEQWPGDVVPLPGPARYSPRARILPAQRAVPERGILAR